jgi:hypothetical protein
MYQLNVLAAISIFGPDRDPSDSVRAGIDRTQQVSRVTIRRPDTIATHACFDALAIRSMLVRIPFTGRALAAAGVISDVRRL